MNSFGLEEKYMNFLYALLKKYIPEENANFYVFGSRAKGIYKDYSDIDVAIDLFGKKIETSTVEKIKSAFENSTFPYEVDVIDLNSISESFFNIIKDDLVRIN